MPTVPELLSCLEVLNKWESFGYFLLPKDKGYLIEVTDYVINISIYVYTCTQMCAYVCLCAFMCLCVYM